MTSTVVPYRELPDMTLQRARKWDGQTLVMKMLRVIWPPGRISHRPFCQVGRLPARRKSDNAINFFFRPSARS